MRMNRNRKIGNIAQGIPPQALKLMREDPLHEERNQLKIKTQVHWQCLRYSRDPRFLRCQNV